MHGCQMLGCTAYLLGQWSAVTTSQIWHVQHNIVLAKSYLLQYALLNALEDKAGLQSSCNASKGLLALGFCNHAPLPVRATNSVYQKDSIVKPRSCCPGQKSVACNAFVLSAYAQWFACMLHDYLWVKSNAAS